MEQNKSHVLKWSLVIGIVIVLNLFFTYALSVVYKSPSFDEFCKVALEAQPLSTSQSCLAVGGRWNANVSPESKNFNCNATFTCQKTFQSANDIYNRNVFITLVVLGVITLLASFFMTNMVIAYGLSIGSVLSFVIASFRYWGSANDIIKLIILGFALVALFVLATKKFSFAKKTTPTDYDRQV